MNIPHKGIRVRVGVFRPEASANVFAVVRLTLYDNDGCELRDDTFLDPTPFPDDASALAQARASVEPKLREYQSQFPGLVISDTPE